MPRGMNLMRFLAVVKFDPKKDINGTTAGTATESVLSLFGKKILRIQPTVTTPPNS
jgi:hypothetical protein